MAFVVDRPITQLHYKTVACAARRTDVIWNDCIVFAWHLFVLELNDYCACLKRQLDVSSFWVEASGVCNFCVKSEVQLQTVAPENKR